MATMTTTAVVTEPAVSPDSLTIKQIYTYPIKSIRGLALPSLNATPLGFAYDRRFMLVSTALDPKTGLVTNMHVSKFEEMCLFTTHVPEDTSLSATEPPTMTHIQVRYGKPHCFKDPTKPVAAEPLLVPLQPETQGLAPVKIRMHHSPTTGHDMGSLYNDWFSTRFGYDVKLLYLGENRRKVLGNIAPEVAAKQARGELAPYDGLKNVAEGEEEEDKGQGQGQGQGGWLTGITSAVSRVAGGALGGGTQANVNNDNEDDGVNQGIGFADVAPFLIISATSWQNASGRLPAGLEYDITKFRPNIVVEGAGDAFDEDFWGELRFVRADQKARNSGKDGTAEAETAEIAKIALTQNCARCNSLNVDFATGAVGKGEDGKILKLLSRDRRVDPGSKWSPIFGRYGFLAGRRRQQEVTLRVGDEVVVSRRNEERTSWEWPNLGTYPKQT